MNPLFSIFFALFVSQLPLQDADAPSRGSNYGSETVYETYGFLSGIANDGTGIVVCDRQGDRVIRISESGEVETILGGIGAPVDVECVDGNYWILYNDPSVLISWNPTTQRREMIAYGFDEDANLTAFALSSRNIVYIVDFRGYVYQIDLSTGTKTVAFEGLDNPADIAVLPGGEIVVTEQVGSDADGGRIRFILTNGQTKIHELIDPTGLTVGPDGEIYATVFFIEDMERGEDDAPVPPDIDEIGEVYSWKNGGVVRFDSWDAEPERVASGMRGPTSLTRLPDGRLAVIEEANNSIVMVGLEGSVETFFRGTLQPLAVKAFADGVIAYLTTNYLNDYLDFSDGVSTQNVWTFSRMEGYSSQVELGGDGLLYAYDPQFSELLIFQSDGMLIQFYIVFVDDGATFNLMTDPSDGIALVSRTRDVLCVQKANRFELGDVAEYHGDYSSLIYFDGEGNIRDAGDQNPIPDDVFSTTMCAVDSNGDVWYVDSASGDVYRVSENQTERIAEDLGSVESISSDGGSGVNVTTKDGRVIHLYPSVPVSNWILF